MGKPQAARRQPAVLSSDDGDDGGRDFPPPKRPKRGTLKSTIPQEVPGDSKKPRPRTQHRSAKDPRAATSPANSPKKPLQSHKPITSFFSNVPRAHALQPRPSPEKLASTEPIEDIDDILDSSDGDDHAVRPSTAALAVRKRSRDAHTAEPETIQKGSQRFLNTSFPAKQHAPPLDTDTRPWNEKYAPLTLDELAVHKKKVSDVRTWLSDVLSGRERKRLLLLKGPAGSGKTTTISLLADELGIEVQEWVNPTRSDSSSEGFVPVTAQFEEFVGRVGSFGSLAFDWSSSRPISRKHQLILVEEFPNTFARASSAVQSFRSSLLNYLATSTPPAATFFAGKQLLDHPITPLVMIVSETLLSTNTAAADSFTAHRLLGPDILTHPGVSVIEFNAIAPTFMTKALDLVVVKEARKSGRRRSPGPQVIQRLSELGDIRNAVSSLEFLCVRDNVGDAWGNKITFAKKKGSKNIPLTKMEQASLELITQRESTLGIFHAVGRVVYNKRSLLPDTESNPTPQPPHWFPERRRTKRSEVHVDSLSGEIGTDTFTFIAALHENYVLSCPGSDDEETMDSIAGCIDALSDADLQSPDRFSTTGFGKRNFQGTTSDTLRQEEMSFHVSVLGLLFNLPTPVKRAAPPSDLPGTKWKGASKASSYAMYYPNALRIWRQQEQIEELLDLWTSRIRSGELLQPQNSPMKQANSSVGGVDTWKTSRSFAGSKASLPASTDVSKSSDEISAPQTLLGSGTSARRELLLERLPYLATILRKLTPPSSSTDGTVHEIERIVAFKGNQFTVGAANDQDDEDEITSEQEQWATDLPDQASPIKLRRTLGIRKNRAKSPTFELSEKDTPNLLLSEDDIED